MGVYIIHKDGVYNLFSTIVDSCRYEQGITLEQLKKGICQEHGQRGIDELEGRLARAHETGCSSMVRMTLEECIAANRAGPNESRLSVKEFIAKYLTLP